NAAIVLIAGNHDPASRLEAPRALFDFIRVVSVGVISREQDQFNLRHHLIPLYDESGELCASILALPYPRAADLPLGSSATHGSPLVEAVRVLYRDAIDAARRNIGAHPLILTGHLHIAGGLESEGAERRILIGGEHAAPSDIFPDDVAYVALGHLHRPQSVGRATIRYAGSLIPMSKTEINYQHGVSLVEIDTTGASHIVHVPFVRRIDHLKLPISGALTVSQLEAELSHLCKDIQVSAVELAPFLHLTLLIDGPATGVKAEVDAICDKFPVRLVSLNFERRAPAPMAPPAPQRLADCAPEALFRRAFVKTHGVEPSAEHLKCFDSLAQEA
ncbi:MAG: exonuclease SbcCD subunit D, partial [Methylocystis sp.]